MARQTEVCTSHFQLVCRPLLWVALGKASNVSTVSTAVCSSLMWKDYCCFRPFRGDAQSHSMNHPHLPNFPNLSPYYSFCRKS